MFERYKPLRGPSINRPMKRSPRGIADFMKRRFSRTLIDRFRHELGNVAHNIEQIDTRNWTEMDRIDDRFARQLLSELPLISV
jgi:hypothetical protein